MIFGIKSLSRYKCIKINSLRVNFIFKSMEGEKRQSKHSHDHSTKEETKFIEKIQNKSTSI